MAFSRRWNILSKKSLLTWRPFGTLWSPFQLWKNMCFFWGICFFVAYFCFFSTGLSFLGLDLVAFKWDFLKGLATPRPQEAPGAWRLLSLPAGLRAGWLFSRQSRQLRKAHRRVSGRGGGCLVGGLGWLVVGNDLKGGFEGGALKNEVFSRFLHLSLALGRCGIL